MEKMNSSEPSSGSGPSSTVPSSTGLSGPSGALEFVLEQPNTGLVWVGRSLALLTLLCAILAVLSFNLVFLGIGVVCAVVVWRLFKPMIVLYLSGPDDIVEQTRYYPMIALGRGRGVTLGVRRLGFLRGVDIRAVQDKRGSGYRTSLRFEQEETLELRMSLADLNSQVEVAEAIRDFVRPRVISVRKP